jgi:phosphopantothenoylcysteine synthetase/decarboxylase
LIVLNSLRDDGGFGASTNKVTFIDKNFNIEPMELKSKEAADDILNKVIANFMNKIFSIFYYQLVLLKRNNSIVL